MVRFVTKVFLFALFLAVVFSPSYGMAMAPQLRSLSPNPAVVGQVVAISGSGFYNTDKILVDNIFVDPINVVGNSVLTFIVPPGTPIRDSGVGVAVKSNGEYSLSLNLKVRNYEDSLSKAKIKKKTNDTKKIKSKKPVSSSDADIDRLAEGFAKNKMSSETALSGDENNSQMANLISVLHYLIYTLSSKLTNSH